MALTTVRSTGISSLPSISGANLTSLTAGNLTGNLPAISGASLTGIASTHTQIFHQETTSNQSEVVIDNVFSSTYDFYHIKGILISGNDNVDFRFRARTGGASGSTYTGSEYQWLWRGRYVGSSGGGNNDNSSFSDSAWKLADNVDKDSDSSYVSFTMDWFDPNTHITGRPHYNADVSWQNDSNSTFYRNYASGKLKTNNNITGLTFYFSSGDVDVTKIVVYGVNAS